ncbi:MAG: germination protein YpeB, partial [Bacillota bacterium]|nr:germination protein YpeB [Bacillota bacterium]
LRKSSAGAPLSKEERKTLTVLSDTADRLSTSLQEVKSKYNDGTIKLSIKKTGTTTSASAKEASPKSSAFEDLEGDFPNYATLIYDGPYSEHIEKKEPVFLKGKTEVTEQEARKKAALFMKTDEGKLKSAGTGDGKIKTYMFSMQKGNGNISIEVTKFGGYILQAIDSQDGGEKTISAEEGVKKAAAILNSIGFPDMKESYYTENDGILTVNYAATENSVICYPDLIKVAVSLHDGSLRSLDTYGYLMNHRKRNPGEPSVPAGIASKKVNGGLKILSSSLAVIPTSGKNETFCHEFKCENGKGKHFIVYVNAKTGIEENILILIEDENGTLTI